MHTFVCEEHMSEFNRLEENIRMLDEQERIAISCDYCYSIPRSRAMYEIIE